MDVVVTGANGFIGSHMVAYLKKHTEYYVIAVDQEFDELRAELTSQADEVIKADLRDYKQCKDALEKASWVFHFAADMGGVGFFTKHDYYPYFNNQRMNLNVLQACHEQGVERLFFSSSACVYPTYLQSTEEVHQIEEDMIFPAQADQMYGWDKLMMLMLCERAPFETRVGIFSTIYGPYQDFVGERVKFPPAIVKKVLDSKRTGEVIKIWGNGHQKRQYCYIDDAVEKIYRIMTMEYRGPVNVAGDELVSCLDVAETVCAIAGVEPHFLMEKDQPSGVITRKVSNKKFEKHYLYKNKFGTADGFTKLYEWMKYASA